ncbi:competence/damage-inducible protein A [Evansella tamaricis]|uniref:Putative competence-damage inducible protein n=1 Tax=Evansella tamaricis TaxID=2069301 RepID=A0ABS6JQ30_9BACI|nr:competence/damage-inducible protein A [Evansella tamaricis]MBU9714485.1 competence/damage-inducible protein A [Evansella tamaricis]
MNAEIIAVGSELLLGQIVNSNAKYLSEQMAHLGINVYHHSVVGDNPDRLTDVLKVATNRSNLIIMTGGLGPTKDDLTKETVAALLGKKLVYDPETEKRMDMYFKQRNRIMTENNRKQAMIIEGSHVFTNEHGLACGIGIKTSEYQIIMLPGPPRELIPMFNKFVTPYLKGQISKVNHIQSRVLRFFDIGESQLVEIIDDLLESQTNPTIAPLASGGEVTLRLTVMGEGEEKNRNSLDEVEEKILSRLGEFFYGYGEDTLFENIVKHLKEKNKTIASAESITGGLFATEVTAINGASLVFPGSIICYSNAAKRSLLSVSNEILNDEGAVSHTCAKELAEKVRINFQSDYGISFTGVAGPDPLEGKPPGVVYMGIASKDRTVSYELKLAGSRQNIRERSAKYGAYYLLQWMRKETKKVDE